MKILVISAARNGQLNDNLYHVLAAASRLSQSCDLMLIGAADPAQFKHLPLVATIQQLVIDASHNLTSVVAPVVATQVPKYTHVLMAADSYGKDLLPRIAGMLDLSQISEVIGIESPNIFKRPMYAGNVVAEVESFEDTKLLTIRPTSFERLTAVAADPQLVQLTPELAAAPIELVSEEAYALTTIDLAQAKVVVSGGHSLGSAQNFKQLVEGLAVKLGGAVGASRAAVEAGFAPNDCQVGQTGKVVAPQLYVAIGISGAAQHIAGMKDAKTVVAINIDPNAQIFEYADYGVVGDLFEVVPALINQLEEI